MEEPQQPKPKITNAITIRTKPKGRLTLPKGTTVQIKNKEGRPTRYNQDIADKLCAELALGKSLRRITEDREEFPCIATIFNWFRIYPEFLEQYTRAKYESADSMADEILDIADDGRNDWMEIETNKGSFIKLNTEATQRSKLRVDARIWLMSKMKPKKYGGEKLLEPPKDDTTVVKNEIIFLDFSNKDTKEIENNVPESK